MKSLKYLIEKEFKQMFRNPLIPRLIVLFPTMVLLVYPWAVSFEIKNIKIDVVDHSKSVYSSRLTDKVAASQYFILNDTPPGYQTAMINMVQGETDMILEIPASFDKEMVKSRSTGVVWPLAGRKYVGDPFLCHCVYLLHIGSGDHYLKLFRKYAAGKLSGDVLYPDTDTAWLYVHPCFRNAGLG